MSNRPLNPRQAAFVREYLIDLNGTQAAIRAGYSTRTAQQQAFELLLKPDIKAVVAAGQAKRAAKLEITADRVLAEIASVAFANMGDYTRLEGRDLSPDFSQTTRSQLAALQEITVDQYGGGGGDGERRQVSRTRVKLVDKCKALDQLGRHLRLFGDKVEVDLGEQTIQRLLAGRKRVGKT